MKEEREIGQQLGDVLHLPPHDHRPLGIGRMMQAGPEKRADADGEEVGEAKEPRIGELLAPGNQTSPIRLTADADDAGDEQDRRQAAGVLGVKGLRLAEE